ncbi:MAG: RNA-binding protein [Nitrospira sp.]
MNHMWGRPLQTPSDLNLLIDGLSETVTRADIVSLFSSCGRVTAAEIVIDADGMPLGVARVTMLTKEEAGFAIHTFHRCQFRGRTLLVFEDATKNQREDVWNNRLLKRL